MGSSKAGGPVQGPSKILDRALSDRDAFDALLWAGAAAAAALGALAFCALDVRGALWANVGWGAVAGAAVFHMACALAPLVAIARDLV